MDQINDINPQCDLNNRKINDNEDTTKIFTDSEPGDYHHLNA
jgi:hypothetical protein